MGLFVLPFDRSDMGFETKSETSPMGQRATASTSIGAGASERAPLEPEPSPQEALQATARVVGRKWHPAIVHRVLTDGPLGFNDLHESLTGLSSKVLSDGLEDLTSWGLVDREIVQERPVRVEYSATAVGRSLQPVLAAMCDWGAEYGEHLDKDDE
jgi:DNA-binding HxlR family transcriptional regulator